MPFFDLGASGRTNPRRSREHIDYPSGGPIETFEWGTRKRHGKPWDGSKPPRYIYAPDRRLVHTLTVVKGEPSYGYKLNTGYYSSTQAPREDRGGLGPAPKLPPAPVTAETLPPPSLVPTSTSVVPPPIAPVTVETLPPPSLVPPVTTAVPPSVLPVTADTLPSPDVFDSELVPGGLIPSGPQQPIPIEKGEVPVAKDKSWIPSWIYYAGGGILIVTALAFLGKDKHDK
mgnify:CR=1 FL=1